MWIPTWLVILILAPWLISMIVECWPLLWCLLQLIGMACLAGLFFWGLAMLPWWGHLICLCLIFGGMAAWDVIIEEIPLKKVLIESIESTISPVIMVATYLYLVFVGVLWSFFFYYLFTGELQWERMPLVLLISLPAVGLGWWRWICIERE